MKKKLTLALTIAIGLALTACGHEHSWTEATCTEPKTCSECGATEGEPLGHKWSDPDCTNDQRCSVCGEVGEKALGHTWVDATCNDPKHCSVCGQVNGDSLGHKVEEWEIIEESTCSKSGLRKGICTRCGEEVTQDVHKAEHTPGEWTVTKEATESEKGVRSLICTVCGESIKKESFELSPEEIKSNYIAKCKAYTFKEIARNPDDYYFTYAKYTGEVVQVLEKDDDVQLRVNITNNGWYYTDTIFVDYTRQKGESRILEDDIVTIYGMNFGTVSYESIMGATITLPYVIAKYIDVN